MSEYNALTSPPPVFYTRSRNEKGKSVKNITNENRIKQ